jgi:glutathione S-transferase
MVLYTCSLEKFAGIEQLSGQRAVPILVLDSGEVITGSGRIVSWAQANEPARTAG